MFFSIVYPRVLDSYTLVTLAKHHVTRSHAAIPDSPEIRP